VSQRPVTPRAVPGIAPTGRALLLVLALVLPPPFLAPAPAGAATTPAGAATTPAPPGPFAPPHLSWRLRGLDGREIALRQWYGRVIHLTKWSTLCGPCVAELPPIEALQDSLSAQGVVFLLVSYERPANLRRFVEETRLKVPVYMAAEPEPDAFRAVTTPATFVVDRTGAVVFRQEGPRGWAGNPDMISYLRSLLQPAALPAN
jgi:peroxiredoxin